MSVDLATAGGGIGFGCGPLGEHGFGSVDLVECRSAVMTALDGGFTFFDTADVYGRGLSEQQLALALGARRSEATIATKGGVRLDHKNQSYYDSSPAWLEEALEASLRRLDTDYIDLYQIHYVDGITPLEESFAALEGAATRGLIRAYGVSNVTFGADIDASQWPHFLSFSFEFSLLEQAKLQDARTNWACSPAAVQISTGVLAQGILTGKYDGDSTYDDNDRRSSRQPLFRHDQWSTNMAMLDVLRAFGPSIASLAIAWSIGSGVWPDHGRRMSLVGVKSRAQLEALFEARLLLASGFDWTEIDRAAASIAEREAR